ncbi:MAG: 3-hydroxybutyryl-CoA dehydrogenase [Chloroflexota bacterium]|jgi:3-hydroxybutyryl-CoA dehydrogenase|nr:3-hydroxybutyryl-CoA dehydrogenase [Chloroflexota bacterium]
MGAGIAQVALEAGHEVVLHDVDEAALERGRAHIRSGLERRAAGLELDGDSIDAWVSGRLAGLRDAHTLDAVGAEAEIVIEAALEDLALKQTIFQALDAAAPPDVMLATNTSALSVSAIASATSHPERVIGLHFFNPVPVMALVEVIVPAGTSKSVVERATALVERWGKTAVRSADVPGFIVNRVNRPYTIRALRLLEAGVASVETIDGALRDAGFPMGPFELIDLVGADVNLAAAIGVWEGAGRPERLRPSPIQERLVADGTLGRKSGAGFYAYDGNRRLGARSVPDAPVAGDRPAPPDVIRDWIVLGVVDEAYRALAEGVASREGIDRALQLGAAHPIGPFERVRTLGGARQARDRHAALALMLGIELDSTALLEREATTGLGADDESRD